MSGYGHGKAEEDGITIEIELRSVNSRYLDISLRLPQGMMQHEATLRTKISENIARGKVDLILQRRREIEAAKAKFKPSVFEGLFEQVGSYLKSKNLYGQEIEKNLIFSLLERKEVFEDTEPEIERQNETNLILEALQQALTQHNTVRIKEGASLAKDITLQVSNLKRLHLELGKVAEILPSEKASQLTQRLKDLFPSINIGEDRIAAEAALLAERSDVQEELVRLGSLIEQAETALKASPQGKRLDFILIEMLREVNTCGSKVQNQKMQSLVIDAKLVLEKFREQVQNLE